MISTTHDDISYIISAEFELTKGTVVSGRFPSTFDLSLENILIEKLIPDGLHNYQSDCFCFRNMVPINASTFAKRVSSLNSANLAFKISYFNDQNKQFDLDLENPENEFYSLFPNSENVSFESQIKINQNFDLVFSSSPVEVPNEISLLLPVEVIMNFDGKILLSCDSHNFIFSLLPSSKSDSLSWFYREMLLFADPTSKKILKALSEDRRTEERLYIDMNFFTVVANKKEKSAQRGAVYRSVTICTETLQDLTPFRTFLEGIIEKYMELPPNDPSIQGILEKAFHERPKLLETQRIPQPYSLYDLSFLKSKPSIF